MASKTLELSNRPNDAAELVLQGAESLSSGDSQGAESNWRQAIKEDDNCIAAWACLTDLLITQQRSDEAVPCLERLIEGCEKTAQVLSTLAEKSWQLKQFEQARSLATESLQRYPPPQIRDAMALLLAKLDYMAEDWENALMRANEILKAEPVVIPALKIRQKCWQKFSYASEDVADSRLLMALEPGALYHSDLLFLMNFLSETTPEMLYEESRRWNQLYAAPLATEVVPLTNDPDPRRRLRIGFVSPDFRHHPVMKLLPGIFERFDQEQLELFAYSVGNQADDVTDYVRRTIANFIEVPIDRREIAQRVRADGIDILFDLAGHTQPLEALLAFALKPAPIQVSWMGVHSTTGLTTMDYFLGDSQMPCPGTEHLFTETIYRLNHAQYCYRPFGDPGLAGAPCLTNGFITFGCFNKPRKITRELVKIWSVILHLHPDSKLLLKYMDFDRSSVQRRVLAWFTEDGILADRIEFEGQSGAVEFLASMNRVDIALDTYPYNGGTTTLETLWMGVPVVAMRGRLAVSCCSASFLSALGFPVAGTPEQYIALANQLVEAVPKTPYLRQQIRAAMLKSTLMDEQGMVRALEEALRKMWRKWCATRQAGA